MERSEYQDEQEALSGIAATLIALAVLAECLCVLPLRVRVLVLTLLRPAEAVARALAVERAGSLLALPAITVRGADCDSYAEALRLARYFRALASVFGALQRLAGRRVFRGEQNGRLAPCAPGATWQSHFMRRVGVACRGAACIDTS